MIKQILMCITSLLIIILIIYLIKINNKIIEPAEPATTNRGISHPTKSAIIGPGTTLPNNLLKNTIDSANNDQTKINQDRT